VKTRGAKKFLTMKKFYFFNSVSQTLRLPHLALVFFIALSSGGCGVADSIVESFSGLVGLTDTGTVITKSQVRSSYAVVAADLLEVKRGDTLDILEEIEFEKVRWYRVRARDEDETEGWIEAQNVITSEVLEKSKELAAEDKDVPAQAIGQLRAASNLRLSPEQKDDNILVKLDNGSNFEIVSWRYVPKAQDAADVDNARKGEQKQVRGTTKNAEVEAAKESNEPEKMDEKYDIWYKVRLEPAVSPAPSGWVFGRQVELQIPHDVTFYQANNRKFVAWQRIDNLDPAEKTVSKDGIKISKPGSWVVLTRSNVVRAKDGVEPDFDGIQVYAFEKYRESYYLAYRSPEIWGQLPLKLEGTGDNKTFVVRLRNANGQMEEKRFVTFKDAKGNLKVTAPEKITVTGK